MYTCQQYLHQGQQDHLLTEAYPLPKFVKNAALMGPGIKVIKLEYSFRLKLKRNDWLLADHVGKQPIIAFYLESENELKFYNLEAWSMAVLFKILKVLFFRRNKKAYETMSMTGILGKSKWK